MLAGSGELHLGAGGLRRYAANPPDAPPKASHHRLAWAMPIQKYPSNIIFDGYSAIV